MLILLSPAKSMNTSQACDVLNTTQPQFSEEANFLASKMSTYNISELRKMLKVSPTLAQSTFDRYQIFNDSSTQQLPALLAYTGSVFKQIAVNDFSQEDFDYAQEHLRIVSMLYGLVRPLDRIKAYRMEYNLKLRGVDGDIYKFWQSKLTGQLIDSIKESGGVLVNLASLEVLSAFDVERIKKEVTIITPEFKSLKNGKYEIVRTYTKIARGAMARYILKNKVLELEQLKKFEFKDYTFNEELSTEDNYVYTGL